MTTLEQTVRGLLGLGFEAGGGFPANGDAFHRRLEIHCHAAVRRLQPRSAAGVAPATVGAAPA